MDMKLFYELAELYDLEFEAGQMSENDLEFFIELPEEISSIRYEKTGVIVFSEVLKKETTWKELKEGQKYYNYNIFEKGIA